MATIKKNQVGLLIRTGFGFTKRIIYKSGGVAVDLSGASARLDIKESPLDEEPLFTFASDAVDGPTLTLNAVPGAIDFSATEEDTEAIALEVSHLRCVYDFKLTLPGEEPICLFSGPALIQKGITQ